jgi:hypothetical protein
VMDIRPIIAGAPVNEARAALYYASRYVKQAGSFEQYDKDIFEEDDRSAPNDAVRALTLAVIQFIEKFEELPAAQFSFETVGRILNHIVTVDGALEAPPSNAAQMRAEAALGDMVAPPSGAISNSRFNR